MCYSKYCVYMCVLFGVIYVDAFTEYTQPGSSVYGSYSQLFSDELQVYEFGIQYDLPFYVGSRLGSYMQLGVANWHVTESVSVINIMPVLRYYPFTYGYAQPYVDLGMGLAYFSKKHFDDYRFSSPLRMQDTIAYGLLFGDQYQYNVAMGFSYYNKAGFHGGKGHAKIFPRLIFGYSF